jgi:hypothetical protein
MPRSSIVSVASAARCSGGALTTGLDITSAIGTSVERPAASTRARRSWSVTMPTTRWSRCTSTQLAPLATISRAASRTESSGPQTANGSRVSSSTRWRVGSTVTASGVGEGDGRASSERAT